MKLLVDINIVLDVILERLPWAEEAAELLAVIDRGEAAGWVAGHTITTAHYVVARARDRQIANRAMSDLLQVCDVVPVERSDFVHALAIGLSDFEDAVQAVCAVKIGADAIVTRNEKDFRSTAVHASGPAAVLATLAAARS
ncbi:MAG: type II toxin-antitoxin system VapC family toxin [Longimicrobiaceae bacterium]